MDYKQPCHVEYNIDIFFSSGTGRKKEKKRRRRDKGLVRLAGGCWPVLICCEKKILLADWGW
jgi:hypothetical protein